MSKVNLVNAYFDGELTKAQMQDFENQLQSDPELKREFDFQNDIVEGLKEARRVELKAMLNNVTVGGGVSTTVGGISMVKIAATVLLLGSIGVTAVWYFNSESNSSIEQQTPELSQKVEEFEPIEEPEVPVETQDVIDESANAQEEEKLAESVAIEEKQTVVDTESIPTSDNEDQAVISKPEIKTPDVIASFENESDDNEEEMAPLSGLGTKDDSGMPTIDVEIDNSKKKYSFHYQLKDGRLVLYGSFDKGLYEILEFNTTEGKEVFLFYKDEYYSLNENKGKITRLTAVKDKELIAKLKKARNDN